MFAGFAIKVPLFPLHTWLPLAHVEAPTAGSVLLAGVLLKVGTYGFARFNLPMLPEATAVLMPWLLGISVAGIIYGALVALAQSRHQAAGGLFERQPSGLLHVGALRPEPTERLRRRACRWSTTGISTGGLFAVVGMIYDRYHTRQIADFGGLARRLPRLAFFAMLLCLSSIALPGTNGFAGEFLAVARHVPARLGRSRPPAALPLRIIAVLSLAGVVLGAWYIFWMYQRVFFGPVREPHHGAAASDVRPSQPDQRADTRSDSLRRRLPRRRSRDLSLREVLTPGAAGGDDLLDRAPAAVLPRSNAADARRSDCAGQASGGEEEERGEGRGAAEGQYEVRSTEYGVRTSRSKARQPVCEECRCSTRTPSLCVHRSSYVLHPSSLVTHPSSLHSSFIISSIHHFPTP